MECGDCEEQVQHDICDVLPGGVKAGGVVSGEPGSGEDTDGVRTRSGLTLIRILNVLSPPWSSIRNMSFRFGGPASSEA